LVFSFLFSRTFSTPRTTPTRRKRRRNAMRIAAAAPLGKVPPAVAQPRPKDRPKSLYSPSTAGRAVSRAVTPIPKRRRRRNQRRTPMQGSPIAVNCWRRIPPTP